jgi:hypothetical protein
MGTAIRSARIVVDGRSCEFERCGIPASAVRRAMQKAVDLVWITAGEPAHGSDDVSNELPGAETFGG